MKNIVLAAALALIAVPALAVGPESFTVDVSRGYQATSPSQQQEQARSNWAPRGQQAAQAPASEEGAAAATSSTKPRATKASGKPHRARHAGQAPAHAPAAKGAAPAAAPTAEHPAK